MVYIDEEILKKREEQKKLKYTTLEKGIYLDGKLIKFERRNLLSEISVLVPETMIPMPEEYARIKYPSEFRPQVILTTMDLSVNLGFTVFPEQIVVRDIKKMAEQMQAAIHRSNPDYRINPCEDLAETQGCFFSFRSHAMDSDLYNMTLIMPRKKKLVQGSFNCPYRDSQKWNKTVLMMWESIEEPKEG